MKLATRPRSCLPGVTTVAILGAGLLLGWPASSHAQVIAFPIQSLAAPIQVPAAAEMPAEVVIESPAGQGLQLPMESSQLVTASATNAVLSPEERRLQEILQLQFDRRPQQLLQTLSRQLEATAPSTNEVQRFRDDVVGGRWPAVGEFLNSLPEKQRDQVYRHVLEGLQRPPGQGGLGIPGMPPGVMQSMMPGMPPGMMLASVLLPEDVLALADLAPAELSQDWIQALGQLLSRALSKGNFIDPVIARLEQGTARLGGSDPVHRGAAVKLLVAAGRLGDAGRFLPPLDSARARGDLEALDLHARYNLELGRQRQNTNALQTAWELTQTLLAVTNAPGTNASEPTREQALLRAIELLPLIPGLQGTNWLRASFRENPAQGMAILAAAAAPPSDVRNADARRRGLAQQQQAVAALLTATADDVGLWGTALSLLAQSWVQEADLSRTRWMDPAQFNPNPYGYYDPEQQMRMQQFSDPNQAQPIAPAELLKLAPDERWLARVEPTLSPRVAWLVAALQAKADQPAKALPVIEQLAAAHPKEAAQLANDLLRAWARTHNPNSGQDMMRNRYGPYGPVYYGPGSPYGMSGQGVALTRAMQNRNLQELAGLVARLRRLSLADVEEAAYVEAFTSAHSQAEVFRAEDIERVFGKVDQMKTETLASVLQTMRQRLATSWRQMRVQQDAKTKRTDKDIEAEVTRGYELLTSLLEQGLARWPDSWRLHLVQAVCAFDFAEFQYGKKVDLAVYVEKREQAFGAFANAARLYAAQVSELEPARYTPELYMSWFNANLGASDLAFVTRQQEPSTNHLARLRETILALPGDAGTRHLELLAAAINDSLNTIKSELKPRYVRAALRVVGDLPAADEARNLAAYYDDLLGEIGLDVRLDGDATVGHIQPFGVFIALRHTADVERESGGFGRYLQNQNQPYYYSPGGQQRNVREDFEKQVREKLGDNFEIKVITFADGKVQSRGIGRPGWRETPLAYVLLKAKDGSVDRLPSLHLDLDFFDRRGQVVLPVESAVVLLDARPDAVAPRPVSQVELTEVLDDREAAAGKFTLEIKATGRGVLPELKELVDASLPGFAITKTIDSGVTVGKLDTEADDLAGTSERAWVMELRPSDTSGGVPSTFRFPPPRTTGIQASYKRYADADLVEVKPELALVGIRLKPDRTWLWLGLGVALVAGGTFVTIRYRRSATPAGAMVATYAMPAQVTPFSALNLLRRLQADSRLPLAAGQRDELGRIIRELEQGYFSRARNGEISQDLQSILHGWLAIAVPSGSPSPVYEARAN